MARTTSISDIRSFKHCRQQWQFSSELAMSMKPPYSPHYFSFGRAWHAAMESYYEGMIPGHVGDDPEESFENFMLNEAAEEGRDLSDLVLHEAITFGAELVHEYVSWFESPRGGFGFPFEVISTEEAHTIPLFDDVHYGFRTDLIIRNTNTNQLWIVDFKTASVMPTERALEYLDTDEQATAYLCGAEKVCGCDISGIVFVFCCTKRFSDVQLLKNGLPSRNKNQYTTTTRYKNVLSRLNLNVESYNDIISIIEDKIPFMAVPVSRTRLEKDIFWAQMQKVVHEMVSDPLIYPSPSRINCSMCSYTTPCLAVTGGYNLEAALYGYVKGEQRYTVDEDEIQGVTEANGN